MFSQFKTIAKHYSRVFTDKKSNFELTWKEIPGHLRPLADEKQNIGNEKFADLYSFTFSTEYDFLQEWEKLEIEWVKYSVKWLNKHAWIRISYFRAIITKERE